MAARSVSFLATPSGAGRRPGVLQVWAAACAMVRARTTRRLLAEMDGRMLADIGVSRSEADREANRPFWDFSRR